MHDDEFDDDDAKISDEEINRTPPPTTMSTPLVTSGRVGNFL